MKRTPIANAEQRASDLTDGSTSHDASKGLRWNFGAYDVVVSAYGEKGVRQQMEDEHLIFPSLKAVYPSLTSDLSIFAIFDGHGGKQAAMFVKEQLPQEMAAQMADQEDGFLADDKRAKQVINAAFSKLDSRIAIEIPSCKDGCTAIVLLMQGSHAIVAGLGDALACLGRQMDGAMHAISLSEPHKPWVIKEKERIAKAGGTIDNGRVNGALEITRSFGDIPFKKYGVLCTPTLRKFTVEPSKDAFVVLGCDGFWNCWSTNEVADKSMELTQKELRRLAIEGGDKIDVRGICKRLVEHVLLDKKSQDNVSVMLILIQKVEG